MNYKIGVDIGTTSTKAILYDEKNNIQAESSAGYPTYRPRPDRAEQNPLEIYSAFRQVINQLTKKLKAADEVTFLSFSSAMHAVIAVDEFGALLTNALIWSDNRAQKQIETIQNQDDWLRYYQKTGTPVHPMSPFAKLLWMKEETELLKTAHKFIGIKEFIFYCLTGQYVVDYSIASATGLFNIHELTWDKEILAEIGIEEAQLSLPVDVTTAYTFQSEVLTEELGLSSRTKLVIGASDGCLANLGSGALEKGQTAITIGTSGALRMTVEKPFLDEQGRTFCYYLSPGKWVIGGAVNNGGNVIQWLNDILYEEEGKIYNELTTVFSTTLPGAEGLFFFPYINGERAPHWDGNLRGTYHGLSSFHTKHHLIRATLEGIMFNLKEVMQLLEKNGGPVTELKASGGFLQSEEWAKLATDILGMPLTIAGSTESSCLGAVLLAEKKSNVLEDEDKITLDNDRKKRYEIIFENYSWLNEKMILIAGNQKLRTK